MKPVKQRSSLIDLWPVLLGAVLVAVWALWPRHTPSPERTLSDDDAPRAADVTAAAHVDETSGQHVEAPVVAPPAAPPPAAVHAETAVAPVEAPRDGEPPYELPIVGPHADDPHDRAMHPHPITAEHVRIQKVNQLIQTLNDAMSNRDVKAMRSLIEEFKAVDPGDEDNFQLGYGVVADCIEAPGAASIAAAHRFYDTYRASPLRRFVRRLCFEAGS